MRAFFGILFIAASLFGYEINHENWAKFYKFSGDANGVKFEVYMNYFKDEFENFKQTKSFKVAVTSFLTAQNTTMKRALLSKMTVKFLH